MILTHPLGLASPYPTWLKHKQSEIPPFAENIFGGKLLADLGGAHHLHPLSAKKYSTPSPKYKDQIDK